MASPADGAQAPPSGSAAQGERAPGLIPSISLPKGGGAIQGTGEKLAVNPSTGSASLSIPLPVSKPRGELGPELTLAYDSGAGNGAFGLGWSLALPAITRGTDRGLPRYDDGGESDVFVIQGAEDLVPVLLADGVTRASRTATIGGRTFRIERYRPRVEGSYARVERWTESNGDVHWRSISAANVTTLYGTTAATRIADPADPRRVFSWLAAETFDDRGDAMVYAYKAEDSAGVDTTRLNERNRTPVSRSAQRYLKAVRYGNRAPRQPGEDLSARTDWMFEVVFDYGEHYDPGPNGPAMVSAAGARAWALRSDPFSSYRSGFEVRTYRLCRRVLLFHHFPDELGAPDCLVRALHLDYEQTPLFSFVRSATASGYVRRADGTYLERTFPPIDLTYSERTLSGDVRELDRDSLANLPGGDGYAWIDLDGDGVPGVLSSEPGGWTYKRNLSPADGGEARLAAARAVGPAPAGARAGGEPRWQWLDVAGDGQMDLVQVAGPVPGFHERAPDGGWEPFTPFESMPRLDWTDGNVQLVDLTGDGSADILISQDDVLRWHPSLGEEGFDAAERVTQELDEERGPRLLLADGTQSIHLADLSGDGLSDLVRVRNGEVAYWPNLGYGRFGAKVAMDGAPWFDEPDRFDAARLHLADVDGSGPTDIVYLDGDGARLYANRSGNGWAPAERISGFPAIDRVASVQVMDLLGNGTACLAWLSPLPAEAGRQMRYVDLMGGVKPHLLTRFANNLGSETRLTYGTSTRFAIDDDLAGRPWITRLPFPVQVVERLEVRDHVGRSRFVTRYAYHHGHYDGHEREFRGFGLVEQWDTEEHEDADAFADPAAANWDAASWQPPVFTRTWFHTGAFLESERVSRQYEHEYWVEPALRPDNRAEDRAAMLLPDTVLPPGLDPEESRQAFRALKGQVLRNEVYAHDDSARAEHPYSVTEQNLSVVRLQPMGKNRHAVLATHPREKVQLDYHRRPEDPRVTHEVTLEVDPYGNPVRAVSIAYGRRPGLPEPDPGLDAKVRSMLAHDQARIHVTATRSTFTNAVDDPAKWPDDHRTPMPAETVMAELVGLKPGANRPGVTNLFRPSELDGLWSTLWDGAHDVAYEDLDREVVDGAGASPAPARRVLDRHRFIYRRDDLSAMLPLGKLDPLAVGGEVYRLGLTAGHVARVFGALVPDVTLAEGGYAKIEGDWWISAGRVFLSPGAGDTPPQELAHARQHFFLPRRSVDAFGAVRTVDYDAHDLLPVATTDAVGNASLADNDYRVVGPFRTTDPNGNRSELAFDALGHLAGTAVMGEPGESVGDSLAGFEANPGEAVVAAHLADPLADFDEVLGDATSCSLHDLHAYMRTRDDPEPQAPVVYTVTRETHASDLAPGQAARHRQEFSYSDGGGHEVQRKALAAAGPVPGEAGDVSPRWVVSGWKIYDNKGNAVRSFEPFFSARSSYEFAKTAGPGTTTMYDPLGRAVAKLMPDASWSKFVLEGWREASWDANDTAGIADPRTDHDVGDRFRRILGDAPGAFTSWHDRRIGGAFGSTPDARAANKDGAEKSAVHAGTPLVHHLDPLGRSCLTVADNGPRGRLASRMAFDAEGRTLALVDTLGRRAAEYCLREPDPGGGVRYVSGYGVQGDPLYATTIDGGARRTLKNAAGNAYRAWDARGHAFRARFDDEQRPTHRYVATGNGPELLIERTTYGEGHPELNLCGRVWRQYDGAGVRVTERYDFKGNPVEMTQALARDHRTTVDWSALDALSDPAALAAAAAPLLGSTLTSTAAYDALDRELQSVTPHAGGMRPNVIQTTYDETDVTSIDVWIRRASAPAGLLDAASADLHAITAASYDAQGRRKSVSYGNGVTSTWEHDPESFRLVGQRTTRPASFAADRRVVQDLSYFYDAAGNITRIRDDADTQNVVFFRNQRVEPSADYTYDALYHLVRATGREHLGQSGGGLAAPQQTSDEDGARTGLLHPGDGLAMATYTETYEYDAGANPQSVGHQVGPGGWTRRYAYSEPSRIDPAETGNRLSATSVPGDPDAGPYSAKYEYDEHGNATRMPHLPSMSWDELDRLRSTARQIVNAGSPETTFQVYASNGQRVLKVVDRQAGPGQTAARRSERVYLGALELYREFAPDGQSVALQRETLRVPGVPERTALVDTRTAGQDDAPPQTIRYQHSNHLASVTLELDEQAEVASYEEYFPYGSTAYQAVRSQTDVPKRYRYTGKERDAESGLYYHGARFYAPWIGRWISCDPAGIESSANAYQYASLRPTGLLDPDGRQPGIAVTPPPPAPPPVVPIPPPPPPAPPPDSGTAVRLFEGLKTATRVGRGASTGVRAGGAVAGGPLIAGGIAFVIVMAIPSNILQGKNGSPHYNEWKDPDTGEVRGFNTYEARDAFLKERDKQKQEAPPQQPPQPVQAPPQAPEEEYKDPFPEDAPKIAPGADKPGQIEEPHEEKDPAFAGSREMSPKEKNLVKNQLAQGKPLTPEMKTLLRADARFRFEKATGKAIPKDVQIHHLIPLEFAHLFPNLDPNEIGNLVGMKPIPHSQLHTILNKGFKIFKVTPKLLQTIKDNVLKFWRRQIILPVPAK